jgi:hypothetical protein
MGHTDVEGTDTESPHFIRHSKIFLQTGQSSLSNVDSIQVPTMCQLKRPGGQN